MPAARFGQPTTQIDTESDEGNGEDEAAGTPEPEDDADLQRGADLYTRKECGECHGASGEGVPEEGSALAGTELPFDEFEDILRTGANGELGPDHLYGPSAISPGGLEAMHAWLQSLAE
jgi:mono/diheme cytochrome c family protein